MVHATNNNIDKYGVWGYSVASHLAAFTVPLSHFKASEEGITDFVVGALIVIPTQYVAPGPDRSPFQPPARVLIIQRAESDAFGGRWDYPGGSTESSDKTLLDALARELFEETGLHLAAVRELAGINYFMSSRSSQRSWAKYSFLVEVIETKWAIDATSIEIKLSPKEHQAFKWATKHDIDWTVAQAPGFLQFMTQNQARVVQGAFGSLSEE